MVPQLIALVAIVVASVAAAGPSSAPSPPPPPSTTSKPPTASPAPRPDTVEDAERRLDVIMNNTRSRENYIRCFMDRGICNKEANDIKKILGEALSSSNCSKCGARERAGAARFVEYLKREQPETWAKMEAKYGKGKGEGEGGDTSGSDTDDDDDDDDDDEEEKEKKGKGEGGKGKQAPAGGNATTPVGKASVSMIF